jgi:hypothetical protein
MTEFEDQLRKAIERGQRANDALQAEQKLARLSADQLKIRHNDFRLKLSDRIEVTLKSLVNQLPGFAYENIYGERGWGGAVSRDELLMTRGQRRSVYSRLEITVKPLSDLEIVDLAGKGTVKNREIFVRNHFRTIQESELDEFLEMVDRWVLEFAQLYMAADAR